MKIKRTLIAFLLAVVVGCAAPSHEGCAAIVNGTEDLEPMNPSGFDAWKPTTPLDWAVALDEKYTVGEHPRKSWWADTDGNIGVCRFNDGVAWSFAIYDVAERQLIADRTSSGRGF